MRCVVTLILALVLLTSIASANDAKLVAVEADRITFQILENAKWRGRTYKHNGAGSGIGFRKDGWVLTTAHQLDEADSLTLICPDGVGRKADRWYWSEHMDLGVVHIPDYEVPVAKFGTTVSTTIGETVFAAGHPFELPLGLTRGIVSGIHAGIRLDGKRTHTFQDYIQFDAQANPGNSGGPLLSASGEVLGLVCESLSALPRSLPGVSFAIPSEHAQRLADRLITDYKKVKHGGFDCDLASCDAWPLEERKRLAYWDRGGVILYNLKQNARTAGLEEDDIVVAVDDVRIANWVHFWVLLAMRAPGEKLKFEIHRKGKPISIEVPLMKLELKN